MQRRTGFLYQHYANPHAVYNGLITVNFTTLQSFERLCVYGFMSLYKRFYYLLFLLLNRSTTILHLILTISHSLCFYSLEQVINANEILKKSILKKKYWDWSDWCKLTSEQKDTRTNFKDIVVANAHDSLILGVSIIFRISRPTAKRFEWRDQNHTLTLCTHFFSCLISVEKAFHYIPSFYHTQLINMLL